jgi:myo-inositol-1-phosphate synthase
VNETEGRRLGLWLVGARGGIATCVAYGLSGLRQGVLEPIGLTTAVGPVGQLPLADCSDIVLGGHEVVRGDLSRSASELVRHGVLTSDLVASASADAAAFDARIRPGVLDGPDVGHADLDPESARLGAASPREQAERIRADIDEFRAAEGLDRVVVAYLASTELWSEPRSDWDELAGLERCLDEPGALPASSVYAYGAFLAGAPFVNFTPNRGASLPALEDYAREHRLPHCGNDGKTGETLLKTVLAPMFTARALRVHSWQGYNMLGNRDGASLADPSRREAKLRTKDGALRSLLGDPGADLHTHVGIDFVPSLHDWKTAWDFVHFEGFLGAKMSLQLTWSGCDSALAAPLVIDLARLSNFAAEQGESGVMEHTACYFKSPLGGGSHDFHDQFRRLLDYAVGHLERA